jgi:hypothetical protein
MRLLMIANGGRVVSGSAEQMFGEKQQIPLAGPSD